jgi:hypothetical protein
MIKHSVADSISTTVCCFLISFAPRTAVLILCAFCLFADPLVSVQEALHGGDTHPDTDVWYPSDYIQYMTVWLLTYINVLTASCAETQTL